MAVDTDAGSVQILDRSVKLTGSVQCVLVQNDYRAHIMMQCNSAALWYSFTNPVPAANATGCFYLPAGAVLSTTLGLPSNALYVIGTAGYMLALTEG